ncbi:branched-chain amino acid transaminase [Oligoflexia bacterium]|nr:branched-chain amino acid transaminase [Oligoflexia bacterium]
METTKYIWHNGELVPWEDCKVHILTHTLHYGGGVFEGIRAYEVDGRAAIFRLKKHIDRFIYSTGVLNMKLGYSHEELCSAIVELVRNNGITHGYIRPLAYYGYGKMGLSPIGAPTEIAIACWPWGAYLPHDAVDIKISSYTRIPPSSVIVDAKICGYYANSILASLEVHGTKYHEALLLDVEGNVAEGPGENLFIVKNGIIYTPQPGFLLAGITRDALIAIAQSFGHSVENKKLTPEDVYDADEAFFTGTAAEVAPIRSIDDNIIGDGKVGPLTTKLKEEFDSVTSGQSEAFMHYLTLV